MGKYVRQAQHNATRYDKTRPKATQQNKRNTAQYNIISGPLQLVSTEDVGEGMATKI